jgi:uncharacterized membrane protein
VSGPALDHRLVRDYLVQLDLALRPLPAARARELREQITAHLEDALPADADEHEVAATLSRLGSPADLVAEARPAAGTTVSAAIAAAARRTRARIARTRMGTKILAGMTALLVEPALASTCPRR